MSECKGCGRTSTAAHLIVHVPGCTIPPEPPQGPQLDHPCRQTCSGWSQGYERGADQWKQLYTGKQTAFLERIAELERERDELRAEIARERDHASTRSKLINQNGRLRAALERIATNESTGIYHDGSSEAWAREALKESK